MSVLKLTPSGEPASASAGEIYYDSSSNKLKFYDGSRFLTLSINGDYETNGATINSSAITGYDLIVFTTGDGSSSYKFKPLATLNIDLLIVAAGGGTANYRGGGGGGQVITHTGISISSGADYYITVGSGIAHANGGDSFFKHSDGSTIQYQAIGGGRSTGTNGDAGGSGGGEGSSDQAYTPGSSNKDTSHTAFSGGTLNNYGNAGGNNYNSSPFPSAGGGGAGAVGGDASSGQGGNGGAGIDVSSTFSTAYGDSGIFGGGGGGMIRTTSGFGIGGSGGGGRGGTSTGSDGVAGTNGTGGGAGGQGESGSNLAGGSGIVIIRVQR